MKDTNARMLFLAFLRDVASNQCDDSKWQEYAIQHYQDEILEGIRARLVKISIEDDRIGHKQWPLSNHAEKCIRTLIRELENAL